MFNLFIIRHGDPDYENDCLTPQGKKDVMLLAKRLENVPFDEIYASPFGRAQQTAQATAEMKKMPFEILDFLHEFIGKVKYPNGEDDFPWKVNGDFYREHFAEFNGKDFFENRELFDDEFISRMKNTEKGLACFLKKYGFEKTDGGYVNPKDEYPDRNVALFCHGGMGVLLLALLCEIQPMQAWQHFFLNTSAVTEFNFVKSGDLFFPVCTLFGDNTFLSEQKNDFVAEV